LSDAYRAIAQGLALQGRQIAAQYRSPVCRATPSESTGTQLPTLRSSTPSPTTFWSRATGR